MYLLASDHPVVAQARSTMAAVRTVHRRPRLGLSPSATPDCLHTAGRKRDLGSNYLYSPVPLNYVGRMQAST
jgi:hypothetical protein